MAYQIVDPASMTAGRGPHPAASPFDKRVGEALGVTAFEVYQVELPPGAETVRHTHLDDHVEDVYAFVRGGGWVVVDDEQVSVRPGQFVAVTVESARQVRAGDDGLVFIALCAAPHGPWSEPVDAELLWQRSCDPRPRFAPGGLRGSRWVIEAGWKLRHSTYASEHAGGGLGSVALAHD